MRRTWIAALVVLAVASWLGIACVNSRVGGWPGAPAQEASPSAGVFYGGAEDGSYLAVEPAGSEREELWVFAREPQPKDTTSVPYTDVITNPDPARWEEITRRRAERRGLANPGGVGASREPEFREDELEPGLLPGCGGLVAQHPVTQKHVVLPLKHTDVHARVRGTASDVEVVQTFANPFATKIEVLYVFPLPADAAVRDFVMTIGERRIRGVVRERAEAERIYANAKRQGHVAALLTEERPNVFTQRVANLEPGKSVDVSLRYLHVLPFVDGAFEFVFPMVVGPRYTPPGTANGIGAVTAERAGSSGQPVEVPYLRPDERGGHDVALALDIDTGFDCADPESRTHAIEVSRGRATGAHVKLAERDSFPNRDFVLRIRPKDDGPRGAVQASLVAQTEGRETCFALTLVPPPLEACERTPVELVFVVDTSGSMDGAPLAVVRSALHAALDELAPGDAFQLVRFSDTADAFAPAPVDVSNASRAAGHAWIDGLRANGGTRVMSGVDAALGLARDPRRERLVCFLTDGMLSNEDEVLAAIRLRRGDVRVFAAGIGSAPNRYLISALAIEGRGTAVFVNDEREAAASMQRFVTRSCRPALRDLEIDWGRLQVADVTPRELPDLFSGRPVVVTGRLVGGSEGIDGGSVRVRGLAGSAHREFVVPTREIPQNTLGSVVPVQWARARIADLASRSRVCGEDERRELAREVKRVALEHGIVSPFTAFVAVDAWERTAGDHGYTVPVPSALPAGMRYETSVGGE